MEQIDNIEHGQALPHDISCLLGFSLKELVNVNVRKSLKPPCLTTLGWPKTLAGLESACEAEQPIEFQVVIDLCDISQDGANLRLLL